MTRLCVEAGFGHTVLDTDITWTEITGRVDLVTGVSITRGASDERSQIQPGTATLTLDNTGGVFTPGLTSSPYWPHVKKNTPIRIRVIAAGKNLITNPSFEDDADDWSGVGTAAPVRSTTRAQHGTASLLATWAAVPAQAAVTTVHGLDLGEVYTASGYVWVPAGSPAVRLKVTSLASGSDLASGTLSSTNGAWERITVTWTATDNSVQLAVAPTGTPADGTQAWVDAVQFEEGAAATVFDPDGAQVFSRFYGMVNNWPTRWRGLHSTAVITCTDLFKWLNRQPSLRPLLIEEVLSDRPMAYYPMTEDSESVTGGDLAGAGALALEVRQVGAGGTLEFGTGTGPAATGLPAPVFTPASSTAGKYLRADLGGAFEAAAASPNWLIADAWFSTTTTGRVLFAVTSTDATATVVISLESGTGKLVVEDRRADGTFVTSVAATANLADGKLHWVCLHQFASTVYVDNLGPFSLLFNQFSRTGLRTLTVGAYAGARLWSGTIAHVALHLAPSTAAIGNYTAHYPAGLDGFDGDSALTRIARLLDYVDPRLLGFAFGATFDTVAGQGQGGQTALAMMQQVTDTEGARLYAARDMFALYVDSRDQRYNPVTSVTLSWADLETDDSGFDDDDQKMINTVVGSRPGGATQRVVDQTARDTYGPYEQSLDTLKTTDLKVLDAAHWLVSRFADPPPELREVTVEAYSLGTAGYRSILARGNGSVLTISDLPDDAPAPATTVFVEGYTETIQYRQHRVSFHCSRSINDNVWVLDDPTYSVLDSTTRLAY